MGQNPKSRKLNGEQKQKPNRDSKKKRRLIPEAEGVNKQVKYKKGAGF